MKKSLIILALPLCFLFACNNEGGQKNTESSDTSYDKDKANGYTNPDAQIPAGDTNTVNNSGSISSSDFLMQAADGGMAEVEAGKMAQKQARDAGVKRFATMMVTDHTAANTKVKSLAATHNVTLPAAPSDHHKQMAADMKQKKGADFDKAYMDMMVTDHQTTIALFEKATGAPDDDVKQFANETLPKLRMHLDSAQAVRSRLQ